MIELLKQLNLPPDAAQWLGDMWTTIQLFDDIEDDDPVDHKDGRDVLWAVLVSMPSNPFYQAHNTILMPVVVTQILKWQAANKAEASGKANEQSYMWRAGYYDLVLLVCYICFGRDIDADKVLSLYGETYAEYKEEFNHA